ncbi:hypothetical protein ACFFQF_01025 [Haladaptatus pallidirubidus]|uniref:Uncharacterized protein n=1 Tax=Haladaptatus pallidirubidus TaxID=1008152 RepID=A0AAV3UBZ2_9EURY|nr:hypothetical protein [Haladaptatus pallidirubidus]
MKSERRSEHLEYAGNDSSGTLTISAVTLDDSGMSHCDDEEMEIEIPSRGVLQIEINGEEVALEPNQFGGNPRVERR